MVLVDTSVWIRFLSNRAPYVEELDRLLDENEATAHDLVYGELLIGDPGERQELLTLYGLIERVPGVPHEEVIAFVRSHKLHGQGIGWIDAHLLASALVADVKLWTADQRLARVAENLGVGFQPNVR